VQIRNEYDLERVVKSVKGDKAFVLWAPWCPHCKVLIKQCNRNLSGSRQNFQPAFEEEEESFKKSDWRASPHTKKVFAIEDSVIQRIGDFQTIVEIVLQNRPPSERAEASKTATGFPTVVVVWGSRRSNGRTWDIGAGDAKALQLLDEFYTASSR